MGWTVGHQVGGGGVGGGGGDGGGGVGGGVIPPPDHLLGVAPVIVPTNFSY